MKRPLTKDIRTDGEPLGLREYEKTGGYEGLRKALKMSPAEVIAEVKAANLRGRGGAGFPTGLKWSFVPAGADAPGPRTIISNSDEMEPGTFKDRILMEGNPHMLIEGMLIGAWAVQAETAVVFLRWSYLKSAGRIAAAIREAYDAGYLGKNILGSGFSLAMRIHTSAGRYICGEETALLNAMEGRRAVPRSKPPYPQVSGLWGKPAVVNNAETFANVPHIIRHGAAWYRGLSLSGDGGTKIFGVSGRVKRPGAWELPMGTTLREIFEGHAGGMREGFKFRGLVPGGASTDFLLEEHLDMKMDFDSLQKAGSRMGTGTMIILDDRTCPVGLVRNTTAFFARESCGWCTPCRDGLPWLAEILRSLEEGRGTLEEIEILKEHAWLLSMGHTYCALAPGAVEPVQSALRYFREDFERHVKEKRCPWSPWR